MDGPNRAWLADIVTDGRKDGSLRSDAGWEGLAAFLRESDDEPVVCSYSVCEEFPNIGLLPEKHRIMRQYAKDDDAEKAHDAFYRMRHASQWKHCMDGLRSRTGALELHPENWTEVRFGRKILASDLPGLLSGNADQA